MKFTVLIENTTSNPAWVCEHGLSLLITYRGRRILLDAGSTDAFYGNALRMGISLDKLDACVLSHGHYDHSGGFDILLEKNKEARVYALEGAFGIYYSGKRNLHDISVPQAVKNKADRFVWGRGVRKLDQDIYLVPHDTPQLEKIGEKSRLYREEGGCIRPDDFSHEQTLVYDTPAGLILFNSCSHAGAKHIIREARAACGGKNVYAYIGGLHMRGIRDHQEICTFSETELDALCQVLLSEKVTYIYTGHCTGRPGLAMLRSRLGDRVQALTTGMTVEIDCKESDSQTRTADF